jgi:ATP-dependent DNA helicase RecG
MERVFDAIDVRTDSTPVSLPHGQQVMYADLPPAAVRESIIKAVMHRDYRRPGPVVVEHTATGLAVTSPGPFVLVSRSTTC